MATVAEFLPLVFQEALGEMLLLPMDSQVAYFSMRWFGGYEMLVAAAAATAGAMLAQLVNYYIGRGILLLKTRQEIYLSEKIYSLGSRLMASWLLPLLLFSWMFPGGLFVALAGFFNVPLQRALPVIALGLAGFYLYTLSPYFQ